MSNSGQYVERYEYKEVSIMGGEPELDVWVGRKGTIPIPDEHDSSKMQTAENKQKQEEQVAREAAQRAVIEYKRWAEQHYNSYGVYPEEYRVWFYQTYERYPEEVGGQRAGQGNGSS